MCCILLQCCRDCRRIEHHADATGWSRWGMLTVLAALAGLPFIDGAQTNEPMVLERWRYRVPLPRAGRAELRLVPGLGERRSQRVDTYLRSGQPLRRVEDLVRVPGIGPGLVERMAPHVTVEPAP